MSSSGRGRSPPFKIKQNMPECSSAWQYLHSLGVVQFFLACPIRPHAVHWFSFEVLTVKALGLSLSLSCSSFCFSELFFGFFLISLALAMSKGKSAMLNAR